MLGVRERQEPLSITSEQRGRATHLRLFGEIDMASAPVLEGWLQAAESNGDTGILVDLEQVTFMDACGLRAFLGAAQRASKNRRTFAITRAPAIVLRVLRITNTTHLLAADAFSFSPDRHPEGTSSAAQATSAGGSDVAGTRNRRVPQIAY